MHNWLYAILRILSGVISKKHWCKVSNAGAILSVLKDDKSTVQKAIMFKRNCLHFSCQRFCQEIWGANDKHLLYFQLVLSWKYLNIPRTKLKICLIHTLPMTIILMWDNFFKYFHRGRLIYEPCELAELFSKESISSEAATT